MKKVLLLLYEQSHFTELIRMARLLKQSQEFEPIFFFSRMLVFSPYVANICAMEEITCLDSNGCLIDLTSEIKDGKKSIENKGASKNANPNNLVAPLLSSGDNKRTKISGHLLKILLFPLRKIFVFLRRNWNDINLFGSILILLRAKNKLISSFLDNNEFSLIIMAEDNVYFDTAIWIKAGHQRKIHSVIVPYTISNPIEQAESALYDPPLKIDSIQKKIVKLLYPRWVYVHKGTALLRLPWFEVLAREWLHLAPPNPWMLNSGSADAIAVESKAMQKYYLGEGLPPEILYLTGALSDDELAGSLRQKDINKARLMEELNLDPSLPIILIALPPNQFPRNCEFPSYRELTGIFGSLTETKHWNVIIRPHPKQVGKDLELVSHPGFKTTWKDTAYLVPLCSLYVACASATIRWAIACGIPVINYDVYQYHYSDYLGIPGVLYTDNRDTFMQLFAKITSNKSFYDEIADKQQTLMGDWGLLDGKSGKRIIDLMRKLSNK